jgi:hypothetical protein
MEDTLKIQQHLSLLTKWRKLAQDHAWLHDECSKHYLILNNSLVVPIIFASMSSGAVNLAGIKACHVDVNYIAITLGIVSLITAGLSTLQSVLRMGERSNLHKQSSTEFEVLSRDIAVEILLDKTESRTFANLGEFVKDCNEKFTLIMDRACPIPEYIHKRLVRSKSKKDNDGGSEDHLSLELCSL